MVDGRALAEAEAVAVGVGVERNAMEAGIGGSC